MRKCSLSLLLLCATPALATISGGWPTHYKCKSKSIYRLGVPHSFAFFAKGWEARIQRDECFSARLILVFFSREGWLL